MLFKPFLQGNRFSIFGRCCRGLHTDSNSIGLLNAENRAVISRGDIFLCYLTRLSRWCGVLEVESEPFSDDSPLLGDPDPFTVRFKVKPIVELAVPIREQRVWRALSITNQYDMALLNAENRAVIRRAAAHLVYGWRAYKKYLDLRGDPEMAVPSFL